MGDGSGWENSERKPGDELEGCGDEMHEGGEW